MIVEFKAGLDEIEIKTTGGGRVFTVEGELENPTDVLSEISANIEMDAEEVLSAVGMEEAITERDEEIERLKGELENERQRADEEHDKYMGIIKRLND